MCASATLCDLHRWQHPFFAELQDARSRGVLSHGELDYPPVLAQQSSSKTRQEVLAELAEARAAGTLSNGELDYPVQATTVSSKTRADVKIELAEYKAQGLEFIAS